MNKIIILSLSLLASALPQWAPAQERSGSLAGGLERTASGSPLVLAQWGYEPPGYGAPNLSGTWFLSGDPYLPCTVRMGPDGRALFINEKGERARGWVRGDQIQVPDWGDPYRGGLNGRFRGNRILWSNGTFWSR